MQKIPCAEISKKVVQRLRKFRTPSKEMAIVLVGHDSISLNFIKEKAKVAKQLKVKFKVYTFPKSINSASLKREVDRIANREDTGGIVVQMPLPLHIKREDILQGIPIGKDPDVLGIVAVKNFVANKAKILPPSVGTVLEICDSLRINIRKTRVAVVGLGFLVGKPISMYMSRKAKNVIKISKGDDIKRISKADLVISGVGKAKLIKPEFVKEGATIIDFGYDYTKGKLYGDFDSSNVAKNRHIKYYTPTPGGTGPILVAKLFENFYRLQNYD